MNRSTKAALLSALVLPGAGHFYLKKYLIGSVLAAVFGAGLYYLTATAFTKAVAISEKIQHGGVPLDFSAISELVSTQTAGVDDPLLRFLPYLLLVCWLIGVVDSYRLGR